VTETDESTEALDEAGRRSPARLHLVVLAAVLAREIVEMGERTAVRPRVQVKR
jgi:hypothetical protein